MKQLKPVLPGGYSLFVVRAGGSPGIRLFDSADAQRRAGLREIAKGNQVFEFELRSNVAAVVDLTYRAFPNHVIAEVLRKKASRGLRG